MTVPIPTHTVTGFPKGSGDPDAPAGSAFPDAGAEASPAEYGPAAEGNEVPVHEQVSTHAQASDTPAIVERGRETDFPTLVREANRLAHRLRDLGVRRGDLVVVRLPRSATLVVALLAVLKAGAAYVPLDPGHPGQRLTDAVVDSGARFIVAPTDHGAYIPAGVHVVDPDDPAERRRILDRSANPPDIAVDPSDLAYAVYTSGSTGRPKAAMVTHGGLANYTRWASAELAVGNGTPLHTSLAFDLALTSLFPALAAGVPVYMADPQGAGADPLAGELDSAARRAPLDFVKLTPTHLDLLSGTLSPDDLAASTRCLVVGGEELRGEHVAVWTERAPGVRVVNSYGPSETAVACCVHVSLAGEIAPGPVPIGRPLPGTIIRLLDGALNRVPTGDVGEVCVGGLGLGRGYLGDPALTAERFVPDPFGAPGSRLYRTGDLARRGEDGALVFVGRRDHQVKIHGHRVEPGEVEAALRAHPDVRAAAVVADRSDPAGPHLAAHVVPAADGISLSGVREDLARTLPRHLVPTLWGILDALPLLGSGKVDRQALHRLTPQTVRSGEREAPVTPSERVVAQVWEQVLGLERVGRHDHFFDLGGQSLSATRVAAQLRKRIPAPVTVRDVLTTPILAELAGLLTYRARERVAGSSGPAEAGIGTAVGTVPTAASDPFDAPVQVTLADRSRPLPLSHAQEALWFLDRLDPGGVDYLVVTALRVRGPLDPTKLCRAWEEIVARHEVLRTRYVADGDGTPWQVVDPVRPVRLPLEERDPREVLAEEARTPLDLGTGPVWRARLVRDGDQHVLVLTIHHIATDGWSTGILADELAALYEGHALDALAVQYADVAVAQRRRLTGDLSDRLLEHWRACLSGLEPTELPTDRLRPSQRDTRGGAVRFTVPSDLERDLTAVGRAEGATPFMTLLAGFFALLARYTGRTDLSVGVPASGRDDTATERLVGLFANTLVLRADVAASLSFADLVGRVRDTVIEAQRYGELPFERLVRELAPRRDLARNPLFQLMFSYREEGGTRFSLPGLEATPEPVPWHTSKFDLTVELTRRSDGGLEGEAVYATALFDTATVERFVGHFLRLLRSAAARPDTEVARLGLLEPSERAALTSATAGEVCPRPEQGLLGLVAERAAKSPDAIAIVSDTELLTYRELDTWASRLARCLREEGAGTDTVVGVCLPIGAERVAVTLGILRAGAAFLPLDPGHSCAQRDWILADAGCRLVVADSSALPDTVVESNGTSTLDLAYERARIAALPDTAPRVTAEPDSLAYVMYTSGSTGRPKGVAIAHRGIANRVLWAVERFGLGPGDRIVHKTAVTFDASVWEFLAPLVSGGTVILPPHGADRDPALLIETMSRHRVTVLQGVPSFLREVANTRGLEECTTLRLLFSAGEALTEELASRLRARVPAVLVNTYGPTECSIDVMWWPYAPETCRSGVIPIGLPLDNTRAVVHTPDGELAPVGVPGELLVAGDGLARGYLGRPGLTAERFVPDPYGPPGARAYHTGDLVRRCADGVLEFLGRLDGQVKIRGVRVEPAGVEAVLARHPGIVAAVVAARPGPDGLGRLVAYVVLREASVQAADLRRFLAQDLPESHLPSVFVPLDRLPVTTSGKTDHTALPDPDTTRFGRPSVPVPGDDPTAVAVARVLADVTGVSDVGLTDDFFDLGGHSLTAIRAVNRIREELGTDLPVRAVFEARTVEGLADLVRGSVSETGGAIRPLDEVARAGRLPLSSAQRRLWFLHRLNPDDTRYHVTCALRLTGALDREALAGALSDLCSRHAILRTRYGVDDDGVPYQAVSSSSSLDLVVDERADLRGDAEGIGAAVSDLAHRPFDLSAGAPATAHLIALGPGDHLFVLVIHHIATDGWSEGVLMDDLGRCYDARTVGTPGPEAPRLQYADFAVWEREHLSGDAARQALEHVVSRLSGASPLVLEADGPRPPVRDGRGARVIGHVPADVARPLVELGRSRGATPHMAFLGVLAAVLTRYTGSTDLVVGTPSAGRGRPGLGTVAGCFVNTVVTRVNSGGDPTLPELVDRVRETVLDGFGHETPFDRVVETLDPERSSDRSPLVDVVFEVRESAPRVPRLTGLAVVRVAPERTTAKFDLTLTLTAEADGGYALEAEYATGVYSEAGVRRMTEHFVALARDAVSHPQFGVSRLDMLSADEHHQLTGPRTGGVPRTRVPAACLHETVAGHATRTPDAFAVTGEGGDLTYRELHARSLALARRLRAVGVGPERRVAVLLDRSTWAVAAMLAAFHAGGVYVPLGTAQPSERLAMVLDDLEPTVIVTDHVLPERVRAPGVPVVVVDDGAPIPDTHLPAADPDRLAYMIYTSGSTGRPKAVMVTHRSFTHHAHVIRDVYGLRAGDRGALQSALTFDLAMEQMAVPLTGGGAIVVADTEFWSPGDLPDRLQSAGVAQHLLTPSHYRETMREPVDLSERLAALRTFTIGADVVTYADARAWFASGATGRFVCAYGPTEATVVSLTHEVTRAETERADPAESVPIGRPVPETRAYVLDASLNPVPVGVPGELCLGGERVARGYLGRPGLTAARFVPDPFGGGGGRLYATGDRARLRADGAVEFLGRLDGQVKVRGFRVEVGEVEAALAAHGDVREAAVRAWPSEEGGHHLVGYVVVHDGRFPSRADLRVHLSDRLPGYMVPGAIVVLDALPLTTSRKLDRRALPYPGPEAFAGRGSDEPRTEVESAVAECWTAVLGVSEIGLDDGFFGLGGHSLLATRLLVRLRDLFGMDIPLRLLFDKTTVRSQAVALERLAESEADPETVHPTQG